MTVEEDRAAELEAARARAHVAGDGEARQEIEGQITRMGFQLQPLPDVSAEAVNRPVETTAASEPTETTDPPRKPSRRNRKTKGTA